jgi:hypothetical protein
MVWDRIGNESEFRQGNGLGLDLGWTYQSNTKPVRTGISDLDSDM